MIRLALLRHGPTAWNRAGRIQGRTDMPLDPEAAADLQALRLPAEWHDADLWASPMQRAAQTAAHLTGRAARCEPALMEMNWGDWEGLHGADLRADPLSGYRDIEHWGWGYSPPGGESPADLRARLVPWACGLTRDSVAICHIGVMRVLLAHATGWGFDGPAPFRIKRNRLYVITLSDRGWTALPEPIRLEARPPCA
ncbi:histidine phosphatase family protein [Sulfitobacter sabulilitoris]|uniref:Histidine phosphatase family protein n=1 Tax=Sulfitobacter sabulilitoris TaxID=2562655 RepID=A0A5S3Q3Z8_9RHOB|nr:histidine phosphatase family protein [Sulfitobacter sabulilitoris]TMM51251.1 histidine phosphatase family protein [Sulfitobacter sabulilitoris]